MSKPGFRKTQPGGGRPGTDRGEAGFASSALFSQAQILHLMKAEFARARRHDLPLGCLLLQVDRMQHLVDLHGLELRHAVREALSRLVRDKTRGTDQLGILSEDRYLLLLPHSDLEACRRVAGRLHELFGQLEVSVGERPLLLTLSIGLTATSAQQTMFFDTLVGQAEAALEWAVDRGGNRIVSFGETRLQADEPPAPDGGRDASPRPGPPRQGGA